MTVNKAILIGNVGKDPESKSTNSGLSVTNFSLATQRKIKEETVVQWHNCVAFGRTAEVIQQYVTKGSKLYVEGSIQYDKYKDKDGAEKTSTKIVVDSVQFLSSARSDGGESESQKSSRKDTADDYARGKAGASGKQQAYTSDPDFDDDIPF